MVIRKKEEILQKDDNQEEKGRLHHDGHGTHWKAFCGDIDRILGVFADYLHSAHMAQIQELANNKVNVSLVYPKECDVQICYTVSNKFRDDAIELITFFPLFKGYPQEIVVDKVFECEEGFEGEVVASVGNVDLSFFAPFFYNQFAQAQHNQSHLIHLAGLALSIENAETQTKISEGDLYDLLLQITLEKHPDKTKADYPFLELSMEGLPMLFPTSYYCKYEFRGKIFEVVDTKMMDFKFKRLKICVGRKHDALEEAPDNEDDDLFIYMYVSEQVGADCNLVVGNDVQGIVWLQGYLAENK